MWWPWRSRGAEPHSAGRAGSGSPPTPSAAPRDGWRTLPALQRTTHEAESACHLDTFPATLCHPSGPAFPRAPGALRRADRPGRPGRGPRAAHGASTVSTDVPPRARPRVPATSVHRTAASALRTPLPPRRVTPAPADPGSARPSHGPAAAPRCRRDAPSRRQRRWTAPPDAAAVQRTARPAVPSSATAAPAAALLPGQPGRRVEPDMPRPSRCAEHAARPRDAEHRPWPGRRPQVQHRRSAPEPRAPRTGGTASEPTSRSRGVGRRPSPPRRSCARSVEPPSPLRSCRGRRRPSSGPSAAAGRRRRPPNPAADGADQPSPSSPGLVVAATRRDSEDAGRPGLAAGGDTASRARPPLPVVSRSTAVQRAAEPPEAPDAPPSSGAADRRSADVPAEPRTPTAVDLLGERPIRVEEPTVSTPLPTAPTPADDNGSRRAARGHRSARARMPVRAARRRGPRPGPALGRPDAVGRSRPPPTTGRPRPRCTSTEVAAAPSPTPGRLAPPAPPVAAPPRSRAAHAGPARARARPDGADRRGRSARLPDRRRRPSSASSRSRSRRRPPPVCPSRP